jgi:hypothetical protein
MDERIPETNDYEKSVSDCSLLYPTLRADIHPDSTQRQAKIEADVEMNLPV